MRRVEINWGWIKLRLSGSCEHEWITGARNGKRACGKCGVWRWLPIIIHGRFDQ